MKTITQLRPLDCRPFALGQYIAWLFALFLLTSAPDLQADQLTDLITGTNEQSALDAKKVITTESNTQHDEKLRKRLQEIFSELNELNKLGIAVSNGVVTLSGEADSSTVEAKALQFARQLEGVVDVENEITINRRIQTRLINTGEKMATLSNQIISAIPIFFISLATFLLFWWIGRWLSRRHTLFQRIGSNAFIARLLAQITYLIFIIIGIVLTLFLLDAEELIGTVMGAAGIVGLAVGIAVRDTVENYIASILLSLRNPFDVNEFVKIDSYSGTVKCLTSRATILISPNGNHIRIPNAKVFKSIIVNYSRSPERRFQVDVHVEPEIDLLSFQTLALETLTNFPSILNDPKPMVIIDELGESKVLVRIYAWVNQREHSFLKVRSEAIRILKLAFDEPGISMPESNGALEKQKTGKVGTKKTQAPFPPSNKDSQSARRDTFQDVSVDLTVEKKIAEEQSKFKQENLLNPKARKEM